MFFDSAIISMRCVALLVTFLRTGLSLAPFVLMLWFGDEWNGYDSMHVMHGDWGALDFCIWSLRLSGWGVWHGGECRSRSA